MTNKNKYNVMARNATIRDIREKTRVDLRSEKEIKEDWWENPIVKVVGFIISIILGIWVLAVIVMLFYENYIF